MRFELMPLGTGAALPARGRHPSAQLLNVREQLYLIDCGEGTQELIRRAGSNFQRIGHIFISHLHGDHYLGLVGLISSMHLMGRTEELHVYGPPELREIVHLQLRASQTYLRFTLHMHDVLPVNGAVLMSNEQLEVTTLALKHRIPTTGYVFREHAQPRRLRKEKLDLIPHYRRNAVKQGEDLRLDSGELIANGELTYDPPPPRSYAYCSDTAYEPALIPFLKEVDLLYHEATFSEFLRARAKETLHSTAADAAMMAREANVGRLLLGHFSSRYKDLGELLREALPIFPNSTLAQEGVAYVVDQRTGV